VNGKPGTRAELAALAWAAAACADPDYLVHLESLYKKLSAPFDRKQGPDVRAVESVLVATSAGKIIPMGPETGAGWWAGLSRRSADRGVTPETAVEVGTFLSDKPWAEGMTVDRVLSGWPSYLARARAEQAKPRRTETDDQPRGDYEPADAG
jgi:hypothetical protein